MHRPCALSSFHRALGCCLALLLCAAVPQPLDAAPPSRLTETSYGAAGQVTGSLHVLDTGNGRWMIDCGSLLDSNRSGPNADEPLADGQAGDSTPQNLPLGVESINALFVTHAHADHLGRVPLLVDRGFTGPIFMTEATAALLPRARLVDPPWGDREWLERGEDHAANGNGLFRRWHLLTPQLVEFEDSIS